MKCDEMKRRILLASTGELPPARNEELREHLAACPDCKAYAWESARLVSLAGESLPAADPSPAALASVRARIPARAAAGRLLWFPTWSVRALAYAAVLAIVAGSWFMLQPATPTNGAGDIATIMDMVSEETPEDIETVDEEDRLRALAERLLVMEGFAEEDTFDEDWSTPSEEPVPTGLRSHKTPVLPERTRV